jgi:hypothetical protein
MEHTIIIRGRIPSKKNCKMALPIKGRCMVVNSAAYAKWQREVGKSLIPFWNEIAVHHMMPMEKVTITIKIFAPDARASDLTNKAESVMDALVAGNFITDDNWFACSAINLRFGGIDRENPRAEIRIINQT